MEAIKTYLDNVFASFPQTERVMALKRDMLEGMEEKYNELKREGKSEHEAIGSVISNFGSIDEIADELGIEQNAANSESEQEDSITLSRDDAQNYITRSRKSGIWIGLGVWLILAGICAMVLIIGSSRDGNISSEGNPGSVFGGVFENIFEPDDTVDGTTSAMGIFVLLVSIAGAVTIFVYNGMKLAEYEEYQKKYIKLDNQTRSDLEDQRKKFMPHFGVHISIGVGIILLAVGALIFLSTMGLTTPPVIVLLFSIGLSVSIFVSAGMRYSAYNVLLGRGEYSNKRKTGKVERLVGTIAAVYWPLATAVYLFVSFLFNAWHISWVVWPVAGVLFGAIAGGIGAWFGVNEK